MGKPTTPTKPTTPLSSYNPTPEDPGKAPDPKKYKGGKNDPNYIKDNAAWDAENKRWEAYSKLKKEWDKWNEYNDKIEAEKKRQEDAQKALENARKSAEAQKNNALADYNDNQVKIADNNVIINDLNTLKVLEANSHQLDDEEKKLLEELNNKYPGGPTFVNQELNRLKEENNSLVEQSNKALEAADKLDTAIEKIDDGITRVKNGDKATDVQEEVDRQTKIANRNNTLTEEEKQKYIEQSKTAKHSTDVAFDGATNTVAGAGNAKYGIDDNADVVGETDTQKQALAVQNFKLPQWGYKNFVEELDNFRKGLTSLTGEPGWFYFKIFFHFDDNYGLLSEVLTNPGLKVSNIGNKLSAADISSGYNSAIGYLVKRHATPRYQSSNLKARAIALHRFVGMLSKINIDTPWFFDRITGLDKAGVLTNNFTEEKMIEISCLEDAVDMRLTTLLHLYQYACYDEIFQKEVIPENLRKFNMSIMIYHVPITYHNTSVSMSGSTTYSDSELKTNIGNNLQFGNRMSYKLFTFKNCEIDLSSTFTVVPGSMDNSKPFNLGKNSIRIKYDRCFTHLMNEWEQIMLGPDGIYYDLFNNINKDFSGEFLRKTNALKTAVNADRLTTRLDSIFEKSFLKTVPVGHTLGNIYNMDIKKFKEDTTKSRSRQNPIYLANLFDFNPIIFRGLVLQSNVRADKHVKIGYMMHNNLGLWTSVQYYKDLGYGQSHEYRRVSDQLYKYRNLYLRSSLGSEMGPTESFTSIFQFIENGRLQAKYNYGTLYALQDYQMTLHNIVDSYVNAWNNLKGQWKSMVNTADMALRNLDPRNMVKNLKGIKLSGSIQLQYLTSNTSEISKPAPP